MLMEPRLFQFCSCHKSAVWMNRREISPGFLSSEAKTARVECPAWNGSCSSGINALTRRASLPWRLLFLLGIHRSGRWKPRVIGSPKNTRPQESQPMPHQGQGRGERRGRHLSRLCFITAVIYTNQMWQASRLTFFLLIVGVFHFCHCLVVYNQLNQEIKCMCHFSTR